MKSLVPWFCLVAVTSTPFVYAAEGVEAYREGKYMVAGQALIKQVSTDPVANYYLGRMRLYGYGELKNNEMALRYFTHAAEKGNLAAQQLLARYYLLGVHDPAAAMTWFKKAAAANDTQAQMFCAAAYLFGYGVNKNSDTARHYYIDAAKSGNPIAQYSLGLQFLDSRDGRNKKLGLIWLSKAADKQNPKAQLKLGEMYATGTLVAKDPIKSHELMQSAAAQNYVPAMIALGEAAKTQGQFSDAKTWLSKAADTGSYKAQLALAKLLLVADNPLRNPQEAASWLDKAAKNGSLEAQKLLTNLAKGDTTEVNTPQPKTSAKSTSKKVEVTDLEPVLTPAVAAARWLTDDKSDQFTDAGYLLGGIFNAWQNPAALQQNNYNQPPQMDITTRKELYKPRFTLVQPTDVAISEYFDVLAPMLTGNQSNDWSFPRYSIDKQIATLLRHESKVLQHGQGVSFIDDGANYLYKTEDNPADYLTQLTPNWQYQLNFQAVLSQLYGQAILGESSAQFEIGQLYQYGIGVSKNIDQALTYYQLAAVQQDVRAEYNLGVLYLAGQTTPVDYQKGIEWMTDAAFKGNAYAQYVLANIYEKGLTDTAGQVVVKANHEQALAMYYLASVNHYGEAEYRLADYLVREKKTGLSVAAKQNRLKLIKRLYAGAAKEGVADASLPLAFYNAMDRDPAKQAQALATARQEATAGNPEAALLLGIMYERGIAVQANPVESLYWYQHAAMNPVNAFILGTLYSEGRGLGKDVQKGKELLQQAADAGFSYANLNLAIMKHESGEYFLDDLDKARQQGNSQAALLLADYYLLQANDPEKMKEARNIYQYLAEKGDKEGQLKLAFLYDRGLGGEASSETAAQWYTLSAEQGQPVAQYLLGQLYQTGRIGKEPDYTAAKKWYKLAQAHYVPASIALGFVFDTVDDDYLSAAENYQLAALSGDRIGQFNLGLIYEDGKGTPVDAEKAKNLYQQSAEKGYSKAMTQLAGIYFRQQNIHQALHWYKKAAALGEAGAQYHLGLLSETAVGTKLNFVEAVKYYQLSSDQGNEKAKLALARMYQYGLGVAKDATHAADLYRELAANNNGFAQYQLAIIYADGLAGERSPQEAKQWLQQASINGNPQASKMLHRLNAQQQITLSFIEPLELTKAPEVAGQSAEQMYFDAISEWNRGDETMSRLILDRLMNQYPHYVPAKRAYQQLNQQMSLSIFG